MLFMPSVADKAFMPSVVMLNAMMPSVIMLNVVAPIKKAFNDVFING
jgi:hypothetical protein